MFFCVYLVAVRQMSMMSTFVVVPFLNVLSCFMVMFGSLFSMMGCFFVMFCMFLRHSIKVLG
jgi:hypothetical protein